jgi:hypothetical protein
MTTPTNNDEGKPITLTLTNETDTPIIAIMKNNKLFDETNDDEIKGTLDLNNKTFTTTANDGTKTVWKIKPEPELVAEPDSVGGRRRRKTAKGGRKSKKCGWGGKKSKKQKGGKRKSQKKGGKHQKKQQQKDPNEM